MVGYWISHDLFLSHVLRVFAEAGCRCRDLLLDQLFHSLVLSLLYDCHLGFVSDPDQAFCQIDLG